ncbi:MAG: redoxin domain-containing protein [Gemmataceae bacterium]|nr:redoxin domain-containing protein [Gemmataceae bacterium]MDW8264413.1 deiodinase-like protein [Gemmataceae bacterium]
MMRRTIVLTGWWLLASSAWSWTAEPPVKRPLTRPGEVNAPPARGERLPDRLRVGSPAPDFTLADPSGQTTVTLSSFVGKKPVVLMFGSYTCPPFRRQSADVEQLYQKYKGKAEFYLVYIREAHPDSVLYVVKDGQEVLEKIPQTSTLDERRQRARQCVDSLKLTMPALVDKDDNGVNAAYAGWPNRLVIVGLDGRIAYISGPGPAGFKPVEVEEWLKANVR